MADDYILIPPCVAYQRSLKPSPAPAAAHENQATLRDDAEIGARSEERDTQEPRADVCSHPSRGEDRGDTHGTRTCTCLQRGLVLTQGNIVKP